MKKEYALYKGEQLLDIGTSKELAKKFNVSAATIRFYSTPAYLKRRSKSINGRYRVAVKLDERD